jgi:trehalose 6-phosphate phosphatase
LSDFDGTLAEIVTDPTAARPVGGVVATLADLAGRYAMVAVVSGRPVGFLQDLLPDSVHLSGLYGLESAHGGLRVEDPRATEWRGVVEEVGADAAELLPADADVELKGLSVTVHYRRVPAAERTIVEWAEQAGARSGLVVRAAKRSVELHPPVDVDKGSVTRRLVGDLPRVCFLGDDVGDVPAFSALAGLAAEGRDVLRVAVASGELDPEVAGAADSLVDGPRGALAFLQTLTDAQPAASS